MTELTCDCGHTLRTNQPPWGKSLLCPACGRQIPVPKANDQVTAGRSPAGTAYDEGESLRPRRRFGDDEGLKPVGNGVTSTKAILSVVLGLCGFCLSVLAGLPALIIGFMALGDIANSRGALKGKGLAYTGIALGIVSMIVTLVAAPLILLFPAVMKIRGAAERMQAMNNLKELTLAMHNYNDSYGNLPLAHTLISTPARGEAQPGMSWRVALLPYIEQQNVYLMFNEHEPWNGPSNQPLQSVAIRTYQFPQDTKTPPNQTYFQVFVTAPGKAPHSMFTHPSEMRNKISLASIIDGTSNTIMIAEAPTPVVWPSPEDMAFDPDQPPPLLGSHFSGGSVVGFADGSTRFIPKTVNTVTLRALITRDGGEVITDPNW